ncbi:MAG: hypothetical protein JSS61_06150 [Verrucomicrobia bacterium]|nr:hypothetical protein [Verrucomicrobiota bacterium]
MQSYYRNRGSRAICQEPLIISFYTENTPYQLEALSLIASCREFDLDWEIEGIPSQGSWERNCAFKPFFILEMMRKHDRPLFWVDVDAVFKKRPDFSFLQGADIGLREMARFAHDPRFKFFSGSLFVNATRAAHKFVSEWCSLCEENRDLPFLDQTSLVDLMEKSQEIKICPLPIALAKVFDIDAEEIDPDEVIVEHYQASRRYRFWKG